jgi:hypothetical protein
VREHAGVLYLYTKTAERAHSPKHLWERIRLSKNYLTALAQVDEALVHWPAYLIHKNKQRLTKITQYLIRARRLALSDKPELQIVNQKTERLERKREDKALTAAKLEKSIERELLSRLKKVRREERRNNFKQNVIGFNSTECGLCDCMHAFFNYHRDGD